MCTPAGGCLTRCCFYDGSPCDKLEFTDAAKSVGRCTVYATRFGVHQTLMGTSFKCASMADWLMQKPAPEKCGYAVVRSIEGMPVVRGQA